jgi:RNA polymerase sigma factor (sigma-70 family)
MPDAPNALKEFLVAVGTDGEAEAWAAFVEAYSRVLLHVARSTISDRDVAMDVYAYLLERLREDAGRRLRAFAGRNGARFTTWLVVVARRLCMDWHRRHRGRVREGESAAAAEARAARRRLAGLGNDLGASGPDDLERLPDEHAGADEALHRAELDSALQRALASLAPQDRLLLRLRVEDGIPAAEVARLLELPSPFHVYRRVAALTAALRQALQSQGIESAAP